MPIVEYPPSKTVYFYQSKWIVNLKKQVFKIHVGDIIKNFWYEKEYEITHIQSNGYCAVKELNCKPHDLKTQTVIAFENIVHVKYK